MTAAQTKRAGTKRLVDTVEDAEHASLEAVRKFIDTVDSVVDSPVSEEWVGGLVDPTERKNNANPRTVLVGEAVLPNIGRMAADCCRFRKAG